MISGNLQGIKQLKPFLTGNLVKALAFMEKIDFSTYEKGKYELDGDKIKANVNLYATQPVADRRPEKHDKYIDVQIVLEGEEKIGYLDYKSDFTVTEDNMASKDVAFYNVTGENFITLKAGDFAILFPWEVHRPNCQSGDKPCQMKKVILKVKMG